MKHLRSQTLAAVDETVTTSARDPIDRWLDVFVRLLRVPRADAQRIRDELEDHLRARVDDLMLTGHTEPDAVRTAVAELGETAELARQFQTATKPHRRMTMLAGSAVVCVGLVTSALLLSPLTAPAPQPPGAIAAPMGVADTERAPRVFASDLPVDAETGYATVGDAVQAIETLVGVKVVPHYSPMLRAIGGIGAETEFDPPSLAGLTLEQGLDQLTAALGWSEEDGLVLHENAQSFELATQSFFDRRDAVLLEYDIRALLQPPEADPIAPLEFKDTVTSLIEPHLWGDRARIGMISTTMLVNAHPRVHAQIQDLVARIEARYASQRESHRQEREKLLMQRIVKYATEIDGYESTIAKIESELEEARQSRRGARERVYRYEIESGAADDDEAIVNMIELAEARDSLRETEELIVDLETRHMRMTQSLTISRAQLKGSESELTEIGDAAEG